MDLVQFKKDVSLLSKVVPKRTNIAIIRGIWSKNGVLAATDLQKFLLIKSDVSFPKPVDGLRLSKILGGPKAPTRMAVTKEGLGFEWENGRTATIPFMADVGDVAMPALPKEHTRLTDIQVDPYDLAYVTSAVSTEVVRYALTGVCFDGRGKHIVASDGKRLHFRKFKTAKNFDSKIVSMETINLIRAIHKAYKAEVRITKMGLDNDGMMGSFYMGRHILFGRLIEGNFPDWSVVTPKKFTWTIKVVTDDLRSALTSAVNLCKGGKTEAVRLRITEDSLKLYSRNSETGAEENYVAEIQGGNKGVQGDVRPIQYGCFNPEYLRDTLCVNSEITIIQGNDRSGPIVVNGSAVLMPLTITLGKEKPKEGRMSEDEAKKLAACNSIDLIKPVKIPREEAKSLRQTTKPKPEKRTRFRPPSSCLPRSQRPQNPPPAKPKAQKPKPAPKPKVKPKAKKKVVVRSGRQVGKAAASKPSSNRKRGTRKPAKRKERARDVQVPLFNW